MASQPGEQIQAVDAKDAGLPDRDFTAAADVRADVRDGALHLVVGGRTALTQDHLDGDPATLTIRD